MSTVVEILHFCIHNSLACCLHHSLIKNQLSIADCRCFHTPLEIWPSLGTIWFDLHFQRKKERHIFNIFSNKNSSIKSLSTIHEYFDHP
jgi:hypothetical protein